MSSYQKESSFFDDAKRKKKRPHKKMRALLKQIGSRKGLLLASILLEKRS